MNLISVEQIIVSTGFCAHKDINNLSIMKAGMTNSSYSFCVKGHKYIIRIPGAGTEKLINRQYEYDVYKTIEPLEISEKVYYFDPGTGIKIAEYMDHSRACDCKNTDDVQICMTELRRFHDKGLFVKHTFDLWERIEYYESLLEGEPSCYPDYQETKQSVLELRRFIESQPHEWTLCHIDSVPDNFLFDNRVNSIVRLIDWEYAGMQDPHIDIAMFAIYSMYDHVYIDNLIDAYFTEGCTESIRLKIYCYIAACGLLWSNWCEYKRKCGVEFGDYARRQYDYAKQYSAFFRLKVSMGKAIVLE